MKYKGFIGFANDEQHSPLLDSPAEAEAWVKQWLDKHAKPGTHLHTTVESWGVLIYRNIGGAA